MDDDLFTYEVEVANIPCDSKMDVDSEQEAGDDMGYDPSDVAFTEWIDTNLFDFETPMCKAFKEFKYGQPVVGERIHASLLIIRLDVQNGQPVVGERIVIVMEEICLMPTILETRSITKTLNDDESHYEQKRRWSVYTNYDDAYEINHEDNEREELCEVHELPIMVKDGCILGTPVMSAGFHAKTSRLAFNTSHTAFFPSIDRLPPIIMVCSGHFGLIATFTFSTGSGVGTFAWRTIWISSDLALSVKIVATPSLVRNFIIPCAVDGTALSAQIPGLPRIPLYFSFGRHLDELHVSWDHLEKKRTRLQTNTKTFKDLYGYSSVVPNHDLSILTLIEIFLKHLDSLSRHIINLIAEGDLRKFTDIGAWVQGYKPWSTTQTLPSFEEYTPPVTYPEEVEKTLGTPIEVEPLNKTKLKEVGLICIHNTPLSSREVPSFDEPEPQPLLNSPSLDISLGDVMGPKLPIKPHSPDSSRMKEMFDDDWGLESKEVSPVGEELSLFDRPNEVERGRILEAHRLESILQQQISQLLLITMVIFDEKKLGSS
ncbi:hypothetical protein Tco_1455720 [Tanacetum coccineum]